MTEKLPPPTTSQDLTTNPLEGVDPKSIDLLFEMDPEGLTKADLQQIVQRLRAGRKTFAEKEAAGKKPAAVGKSGAQLTLEDLGF